jgi:hypothetical protein
MGLMISTTRTRDFTSLFTDGPNSLSSDFFHSIAENNAMKTLVPKLIGLAGVFLVASTAFARNFALDWFTLDLGGGTSTAGGFTVIGSITAPASDLMTGGDFSITGEFSSLIASMPKPVEPVPIFENFHGIVSDIETVTPVNWKANKFCVGSQPYMLDSVTLFLGASDTNTPSVVRLQIYSNDPAITGQPSSPVLMMNLSGATNPITFTEVGIMDKPVKWIAAMPFILATNQCYWVVLGVDSGEVLMTATFAMPKGAAGTFGRSNSYDAGETWASSDNTSNGKMLVQGTAVETPFPTPELVITAVAKIGSDLKLSFTSVAGQSYAVEIRDHLASGTWISFPAPPISGTGGTIEATLPITPVQPRQFYRVGKIL